MGLPSMARSTKRDRAPRVKCNPGAKRPTVVDVHHDVSRTA